MNERISHRGESVAVPSNDAGGGLAIDACLDRQVWHMLIGRQIHLVQGTASMNRNSKIASIIQPMWPGGRLGLVALLIAASMFQPPRSINAKEQATMTTDHSSDRLSPARLDAFWAIIEASRQKANSQDMQLGALKAELAKLSPHDITQFAETMDGLLDASYSWKLWGAAYVMMGGASDDSFEYFRLWLIAGGREFFGSAVSNPDELATLLSADFAEFPDFESMAYAATEVWEDKTGKAEFDAQPAMMPMRIPDGEKFSEDEGELSKAYPKLFARFGHDPLQ